MNPFDKLILKLTDIETEIQDKALEIAASKGNTIEKMQVKQIDQSLNASGQLIKPPYSKRTKILKLRAGRSGNVDLRDKGDFLNQVESVLFNDEIHIVSFDEKSRFLVPKYDPFGLMEENMDKLRILVKPELINYVRAEIGL